MCRLMPGGARFPLQFARRARRHPDGRLDVGNGPRAPTSCHPTRPVAVDHGGPVV